MAAAKRTWSPELRSLGERAALARKCARLSQREAAERIGVDSSQITRLESGERLVELDNLIALARLYDVRIGWLIAGEGEGPKGLPLAGDRRRAER